MANLIIKPATGTGNKLILQDKDGDAVLTTADSGVDSATSIVATKTGTETLTNKTLTTPTIASMANCTFPAGHVLQVVQGVLNTGISNTTEAGNTDIVSVTITPSASANKVWIMFTGHHGHQNPNGALRLYRGSTGIGDAATGYGGGTGWKAYDDCFGTEYTMETSAFNYLDSPNTTSATVYKIQCHSFSSVYWNMQRNGSGGGTTTITAMEIAG